MGAAALAAILFLALRVPQAYSALLHRKEEIRVMQRRITELKKENQDRQKWIRDFKENPAVQSLPQIKKPEPAPAPAPPAAQHRPHHHKKS